MFSNIPDMRTMPGKFLTAPDIDDNPDFTRELKKLEENMATLEQKQKLLDSEQDMFDKEEHLSRRSTQLKEYEKDVEEAEVLLDKRENLVKQRSQEIESLSQDLLTIKKDLQSSLETADAAIDDPCDVEKSEDTNDQLANNNTAEASSNRARRNWQLARRHLVDKVSVLEATVQRYRTQVASSSATITAKDMIIDRLEKENSALKDEIHAKDKRMKQLESRLTLTIQDKTRSEQKLELLLEELQNIDLTTTSKMLNQMSSEKSTMTKETDRKGSLFSFLPFPHSANHSSSTNSSLRKRLQTNKGGSEKTPARSKSANCESNANGDANTSDETMHNDDDVFANGDNMDENGSKACSVM